MIDRLSYALIGFIAGALLGVACWWLYGLGMSPRVLGTGIDPVLSHWVTWLGLGFAAVGFVCRAGVGDVVSIVLSLAFDHESGRWLRGGWRFTSLVLLAMVVIAAWWWMPVV